MTMFLFGTLVIAFAVIAQGVKEQAVITTDPNIDYQIHSNNDLRQIAQVLRKGARKFKFDPHYVTGHSSCEKKGEPCFLLNHDNPVGLTSYNTSTQLLNYFASEEFQTITNGEYISVAFCFKSAPDMCKTDSAAFQSWVSLVDEFHSIALATAPKNVEFILDGDAKPAKCLVGKWQPWMSVWITSSDSTNSQAFYSNDTANDFYRFQILNNPENETNWEWMSQADVNYGKFSSSLYPYQLWEPDSQEDIQMYKDIYLNGMSHAAGYHFAINTDIAMFRVYSSSVGKHQNNDYPEGISQSLDTDVEGQNPIMILMNSANQILTFVTSKKDKSMLYYYWVEFNAEKYSVVSSSASSVPVDVAQGLQLSADNQLVAGLKLDDALDRILLLANNGMMLTLDMVEKTQALVKTTPVSLNLGFVFDAILTNKESCGQANYCLAVSSRKEDSSVLVSYVGVDLLEDGSLQITSTSSCSMVTPQPVVDDAKLVQTSTDLLLFISTHEIIYGTILEKSPTLVASKWVSLTIGKNFDVSRSSDGLLTLVTDNGYCFNSHEHNTRAYPLVCSSLAVANSHTLDYNIGWEQDWMNILRISACNGDCYAVNSCADNGVFHGTYDQGSKPKALVLPSTSTSNGKNYFFLELHDGLSASEKLTNTCGEPLRREGVVVDSFAIDEWVKALKNRK